MPRIMNWTKPDSSGYKGMGFAQVEQGEVAGVTDLSGYLEMIGGTPQGSTQRFPIGGSGVPTSFNSQSVTEFIKKNWLWLVIGGVGGMVLFQRNR